MNMLKSIILCFALAMISVQPTHAKDCDNKLHKILKNIQSEPYNSVSLEKSVIKYTKQHNNQKHYTRVQGVNIPKHSSSSKWRAIAVLPQNDRVSSQGYLSGFKRLKNIKNTRTSKYKQIKSQVDYPLADGRSLSVTAQEARALEFSFLDSLNPKPPKDIDVLGIHDDLEKIILLTKQSGSEILLNPNAYIRIDEINVDGLNISSAEKLYKKFDLSNPNYSPKGEYIVDGSIPSNKIVNTFKFKYIKAKTTISELRKRGSFIPRMGDKVAYKAINGKKFYGYIASVDIYDDYITLYYYDDKNIKKFDISHISDITPLN